MNWPRASHISVEQHAGRRVAAAGGSRQLRKPAVLDGAGSADAEETQEPSALVENFAGQWLEIRRLESVQPDRDRFPDFDDYLRASMLKETELFFQEHHSRRPQHPGFRWRQVHVFERTAGAPLRDQGRHWAGISQSGFDGQRASRNP